MALRPDIVPVTGRGPMFQEGDPPELVQTVIGIVERHLNDVVSDILDERFGARDVTGRRPDHPDPKGWFEETIVKRTT